VRSSSTSWRYRFRHPGAESFDSIAARRGEGTFSGKGRCSTCHVPPLFTEPDGTSTRRRRFASTTSRRIDHRIGLTGRAAARPHDAREGGFYHDGRFADLGAVVDHYDRFFSLAMMDIEKHDLIEYLKSL